MTRKEYRKELEDLRTDVVRMSDLVVDRLRTALDALDRKDDDLAREVIDGDDEINRLYLELEDDCVGLIARQQPVASDLRFVVASFKIVTDLERIGDLATNVAEYALAAERGVYPEVDVQEIGVAVAGMVDDAAAAYTDRDAAACREIHERDDVVDRECARASEAVFRNLLNTRIETGDEAEFRALTDDASRILLTIRDLERVGDHAVNVAARTFYAVEGSDELLY